MLPRQLNVGFPAKAEVCVKFEDQQLLAQFDKPIAFHRIFVTITGSVTAALMLSQLVYWTPRTDEDADGWIYKTRNDWFEEIGLSRDEQETARKVLRKKGLIDEQLKGVPAKLYYRVNLDALRKALFSPVGGKAPNKDAGIPPTRMRESTQQAGGKPAYKMGGKRQTYTESTSETTTARTPLPPASGGRARRFRNIREPGIDTTPRPEIPEDEIEALNRRRKVQENLFSQLLRPRGEG